MKGVQLSLLVSTGLGEIKLAGMPHDKSEKNSKRVTTRWPVVYTGGGPGVGVRERSRVEGNIKVMAPPAGRGEGAVNESVAVLDEAPGVRSPDAMVKET